MYGLFAENGPFYLSEDGSELIMRNTSWNDQYNIMFIDNPSVGRMARRDRTVRVDGQNAE
jgi:carboxypeptidase C (cathepsin A)